MPSQFNSYIDTIDTDFWRELCTREGELRHFERGDEFITAGTVGRWIGYAITPTHLSRLRRKI